MDNNLISIPTSEDNNLTKFKTTFSKIQTNIHLDRLKEQSSSFFNFLNKLISKKEIISLALYKSDIIFAISDSCIIIYDAIHECLKFEVTVIIQLNKEIINKKSNLIQIEILFENKGYIENDYLVCLCDNSLILLDTNKYQQKFCYELKFTPVKFNIDFHEQFNRVRVCIYGKNNILISEYLEKSYFVKLIEIDSLSTIIQNILFLNQIILYEAKNKIVLLKLDYARRQLNQTLNFDKKDLAIYKDSSLYTKDQNSNKNESNLIFSYSELRKEIYIIFNNKIFVIKNNFDDIFSDVLDISHKISKASNIINFIVEDPYAFIFYENKIQINFINDIDKPLESIEMENNTYKYLYVKPVNNLYKQKKFNLETELINYSDILHLKKVKYDNNNNEIVLNSNQHLILSLNSKRNQVDWIYSTHLYNQIEKIKSLNLDLICNYLKYLKSIIAPVYNKEDPNNLIVYKKCVEIFFHLLHKGKFEIARNFHSDTSLDFIFIVFLLKNFILPPNLHKIIKLLIINLKCNPNDYEQYIISTEENILKFLKAFLNRLISFGNEYHKSIEKEVKRNIRLDVGNNVTLEELSEKFTDEQLRYILLENIIFICHFITYKFSRKSKYTDQMKIMIKNSHRIIEKEIIDNLVAFNLEEEILLYYYYRGNYCLCINTIISIYNNLEKKDKNENDVEDLSKDNDLDKEIFMKLNNSFQNTLNESLSENLGKVEKLKEKWFIRYLNLILIVSDKISHFEYTEYTKWALMKNPFNTIDLLFEYKKLSTEKLDMEMINLLKNYGIDPVIYYFFSFIQKNTSKDSENYNEIVNLYTIKLKLLLENFESISSGGSNKEIKKIYNLIQKTRSEFLLFLIENENFNIKFALEKVHCIPNLDIELGVLLIKNEKIEEGISKFFETTFEDTFKILKKINMKLKTFDILSESIKLVLSEKGQKFTTERNEKVDLCFELIEIFKEHQEILLEIFCQDYFDHYQIDKFLPFIIKLFARIDVKSKSYKIENSLVDEQLTHYYNTKNHFERKFFLIDDYSTCHYCRKGFFDSELVYIYPKVTYHLECYNNKVLPMEKKDFY